MKKQTSLGRLLSLLMALALLLSLCVVPASAAEPSTSTAQFLNTTQDGGENMISLTNERTFKASIPVNMTEAKAQEIAAQVVWSLLRDESQEYLDDALYPNQFAGGALDAWVCSDGETPFFSDVTSGVEVVNGQVYLTVTFSNSCYFGDDFSAPHVNGGYYLDVCGYFNLTADLNGQNQGSVSLKIAPYDSFHTMAELYEEIDAIVDFAADNTDLYVEKCSMGKSQGDNGLDSLDMPYLIVAKNKAAVEKWQTIKEKAESDPSALIAQIENGTLGDYQVPVLYSNVHANEVAAADGVLAFAWMLVNTAASERGTVDYDKLTGFTAAGEAELAAQMGEKGAEGSVAVPDLVADTATYLGYIKGENADGTTATSSTVVDLEKYYTIETETVDVDDLLDDVFFLIVPEENVEGRTYVTRTSSGGFDLNRDNSFQTQAETQNMTQLIAQWNPVSFTEFHGRVSAFQCEPCDPPHEPNFEYDLLAEHLMTGGEALGIAAVANNDGHNSYVIPQRDYLTYTGEKTADGDDQTQWLDPWDDMSTSYTPQYAMLHGTVAYTVEVPAYDEFMVEALSYGQLGQSAYIAENKESYLLAQTKIFERGVTNANSDAYDLVGQWFCDQYDVEGAEADLFRPEYDGEGENGNFYPECYIIPMDGVNQSNLQAAADMMEYLARNGVKVNLTEEPFTYDGVTYPAGTLIVSMYQAKRSVANGVLYDGTVITEWPVLYSEGITAFNKTRGFDMAVCAEPAAYETIADACGDAMDYADAQAYVSTLTSSFTGVKDAQVILVNASEDSTAAVNALLKAGKEVSVLVDEPYMGSFLCSYADWLSVADDYLLTGIGVETVDSATSLIPKAPVIYISGKPADNDSGFVKSTLVSGAAQYNYDRQAMETLGFTVTENAAEADLIIGAAALDAQALAAVKSGTPYIGYGSNAINSAVSLFEEGQLVRESVSRNAMDALAYVTYPTVTPTTASYISEGDDILYGYGAGYFAAIPDGAQVLVQLDGSKELLEGFLPSTGEHYADFLDNSIQAIAYQGAGADGAQLDVVLFANTLTNKTHQRDEYNFISNTAFASVQGTGYTDVAETAWYAESVMAVTDLGLMNGTSTHLFSPMMTTDRAMMVTVLYRMAGSPAGEWATTAYADVTAGSWYETAVNWAADQGVTQGVGTVEQNGATYALFAPTATLTREQAVALLYNYAKAQGYDTTVTGASAQNFSDYGSVAGWAKTAMDWAVETGLLTGTSAGTLNPQGSATRAELSALLVRAADLFA
ncbi:S-layer homology domain-containing protein [Pseudoflavonifractor phocaeensis]|uniref:S-layer homology domain-containing protein n=1 Tax=Pseudoflavonifractor phocaeensis TaxID=1870988 RepID=UPI00195DBC2A|nr:S-layer homology domain-containing protein [Pseudoflavonifractor phocaeensis]MBM6939106.1 S-layer homology domain-containing protein [Pseudoflavonifractor phocaeensis]